MATSPVPLRPPPDLERFLRPVLREGAPVPVSWELSPPALVADRRADPGRVVAALRAWQETFSFRVALTEAVEVARFGEAAAADGWELLGRLRSAAAVFDVSELELLSDEIVFASATFAASPRRAWVFTDIAGSVLLRTCSVQGVEAVAGGDDWELAVLVGRGLRFRRGKSVFTITGWRLSADGIVASVSGGTDLVLRGPAARAVAQLAPASPAVTISEVPLVDAYQPLLDALDDALAAAAVHGTTLVVAPQP